METVKWLWNKHFAAVTGDAWAFEALPPVKEDGSDAAVTELGKSRSSGPVSSRGGGHIYLYLSTHI